MTMMRLGAYKIVIKKIGDVAGHTMSWLLSLKNKQHFSVIQAENSRKKLAEIYKNQRGTKHVKKELDRKIISE